VWWGAEPVDVVLGADECWVGGYDGVSAKPVRHRELRDALQQVAHAKLRGEGQAAARGRRLLGRRPVVRVWLSGAWASPFVVPSVAGLRRWHEAEQVAAAAAAEATGLAGNLKVALEDWPGERPGLAVAAVADVVRDVEQTVIECGWVLHSIRPWFCRALALQPTAPTASLVAIEDGDALTVLGEAAGHMTLARTYAPRPEPDARAALLTRLALAESAASGEWLVIPWQPEADLAVVQRTATNMPARAPTS
jgi:hypothetical protein